MPPHRWPVRDVVRDKDINGLVGFDHAAPPVSRPNSCAGLGAGVEARHSRYARRLVPPCPISGPSGTCRSRWLHPADDYWIPGPRQHGPKGHQGHLPAHGTGERRQRRHLEPAATLERGRTTVRLTWAMEVTWPPMRVLGCVGTSAAVAGTAARPGSGPPPRGFRSRG